MISVQPAVLSERLKKVLVDRVFSSAAPEFMEHSSLHFVLTTILNVLSLYLKRIFLD